MAIGVVIKMHDWKFNTPNKGRLIDLTTKIEYDFMRPTITGDADIAWNVKLYDAVTFDISGNEAINVSLHRKFTKGFIFS